LGNLLFLTQGVYLFVEKNQIIILPITPKKYILIYAPIATGWLAHHRLSSAGIANTIGIKILQIAIP
jgi:hypothetical protein